MCRKTFSFLFYQKNMGNIKKKILDISTIGIADITTTGIAAGFWFYLASIIGPEGYGEITFLMSIAALGATLSLFGAVNTLMVYSAKKVPIQSTINLLTLISGSISSIVLFVIFLSLGTSLLVFGYIIFALVTSDLLGKKLFKSYSKYVIIQKILMTVLSLGLYYLMGVEGVLIGMVLSYSPLLIKIVITFREQKINFQLVKQRFNFIFSSYLETISGALHSSLDKIIIAPLFGYYFLGNYSLSLQFYFLLIIIPTIVFKYVMPNESSGNPNIKLKKLMIIGSIGLAVIGYTVGPEIISSIFPKFQDSANFIKIISWTVIPQTISLVHYQSKFLSLEKSKNVFLMSLIGTIFQVIGIIILGSIYEVEGIAIAFVLGAVGSALTGFILDKYDNRSLSQFKLKK